MYYKKKFFGEEPYGNLLIMKIVYNINFSLNLDSRTSQDVLGLLKMTAKEFHQTVIMITHNDHIAQLADRVIRIEDGHLSEEGEFR